MDKILKMFRNAVAERIGCGPSAYASLMFPRKSD